MQCLSCQNHICDCVTIRRNLKFLEVCNPQINLFNKLEEMESKKWNDMFLQVCENPRRALSLPLPPELKVMVFCRDKMSYNYIDKEGINDKWLGIMKFLYDDFIKQNCTKFIISSCTR